MNTQLKNQEILRIDVSCATPEFMQVVSDFKQHIEKTPKSTRGYLSSFMKGMFFYGGIKYKFMTLESFHYHAVNNQLQLDKYEYIFVDYPTE